MSVFTNTKNKRSDGPIDTKGSASVMLVSQSGMRERVSYGDATCLKIKNK